MMEKSYFIADVTKDENEKERVVIKYYNKLSEKPTPSGVRWIASPEGTTAEVIYK